MTNLSQSLAALFDGYMSWLIFGLVLMGLELLLPGVYLLWIGLAAMLAGLVVLALPELSLAVQLLVFAAGMIVSIYVGVLVQRRRSDQSATNLNTGLDYYIGREVSAAADFQNGRGRVRVDDTWYDATCPEPLATNAIATVVAVKDGVLQLAAKPN